MRKFLSLFMVLMLSGVLASAQTHSVKGVVTGPDGHPLPGITIQIQGTKTATATNSEGQFELSATSNATLIFSGVGFEEQRHKVGDQSSLNVSMASTSTQLSEVVVTALGIQRTKNSLPYAAQTVEGDAISETRSGNAASTLSGKVSGLQIQQGNGIGGSTNVLIRGIKSLTGNNQALFVVDGVPLNNSITNSNNQKTGRGGFDYGNAASDINPDEIASITVLKGAASTALYGSQAANGVILVTTKKGKKGLGITVNSGVTFNSMDKSTWAKYQNQYGAGYATSGYGGPSPNGGFFYFDADGDGVKDLVVPTTEDASYGQKFDPNLNVFHWDAFDITSPFYQKARPWVAAAHTPEAFYENSVSTVNNINLTGGNDKGTFFMSYTRNDDKGILPNSRILKNIVNLNSSYKLTDRLTATGSAQFSKVDGLGRYGTGYDNWNVNQNFRQWYETNMDVTEQRAAYFRSGGQNITWNMADPSNPPDGLKPIFTDNPYFVRYSSYENDTRSRFFGYASLQYQFTSWFNLLGRASLDTYNELQEERIAYGSVDPASYSRYDRSVQMSNYDVIANFDTKINADVSFKGLLGMTMNRNIVSSVSASTNGGLVVPGLYSLSNSKDPISAPLENYNPTEVDGYYAGATFGYKDFLFLDGTFRRDISSTLPDASNAYNYYSVSGGWIFSKNLTNISWLSYGKLRANYAEVGNTAPWGAIADIYAKPDPFGSAILFSLPSTKANSDLKPERTTSKEVGVELGFFNNRLGLDATYYITNTKDQLIPVQISQSTGYASKYLNAGDVQNKGFELTVRGTPVVSKDFKWDITVNFSTNKNKVVALFGDAQNLPLASYQGGITLNAPLNQPFGQLWGKTYVYEETTGLPTVKANGRYALTTSTTNNIGNVFPDWIGGVYNTVSYKGFSLGFLLDVRSGGSVFSLDSYYGMATGIYPETATLNDLGNPSRNPIADGGGIIVPGVTADGKPNTKRVENVYGTYGYSYNPNKAFVYDASYVKLREATLSYSLPKSLVIKTKVLTAIDLSVYGRNLWIISKHTPYSDPEENLSAGNWQGYQSGAYPTTRSIGVNLKLQF